MAAATIDILSRIVEVATTGDINGASLGIYWNVTILATFGGEIFETLKATTGE